MLRSTFTTLTLLFYSWKTVNRVVSLSPQHKSLSHCIGSLWVVWSPCCCAPPGPTCSPPGSAVPWTHHHNIAIINYTWKFNRQCLIQKSTFLCVYFSIFPPMTAVTHFTVRRPQHRSMNAHVRCNTSTAALSHSEVIVRHFAPCDCRSLLRALVENVNVWPLAKENGLLQTFC